jgi:maleylacetate reductase
MNSFVYEGLPTRVVFGAGTRSQLDAELTRLGVSRALLLCTPRGAAEAKEIAALAPGRIAGTFAGARMHTPVDVTEQALTLVRELNADATIALGGGSTTGLAKAIALRTDLPQICLPTTYAGSEMTPILGETQNGLKTTQRTPKVLPETVIYDIDLSLSLPSDISAASGMNAIAHAVEALYAKDANPVVSLIAEEGIRAFASALPRLVADPSDRQARTDAMYGAWLCGMCLGSVGMALHHKLCHTLGGTFDLPHAETHAIVLPHAVAYTGPAASEAMRRIARALGAQDAAQGLFGLATALGIKRSLRELGMPEAGIDKAADLAVSNPYWNPRPVERDAVRGLIARAWAGERPAP